MIQEEDSTLQKPKRPNLLREGVQRLRALFLPSEGLHIGENKLIAKKDAGGNQDPYWQRQDGTEMNLTGELKFARATSTLTLTTSFQSITGDGDSSKVRLLLPTVGDWLVEGVADFAQSGANSPGALVGSLFVDDSGTEEDGNIIFIPAANGDRVTAAQRWKVTTAAADVSVELKAKMLTGGGNGQAITKHTTLSAAIGAGGGSSAEATDHGGLTGLGDTADHAYALLKDGSRALTGDWDAGSQKITVQELSTDTISEEGAGNGVTIDSVLLKDAEVTTDIINEKTVAAGVSIDGLLIKDNFIEHEEIPTPANPALNNLRMFARASGTNIQLIALSSQGAECVICTLDDTAVAHTNTLTLNFIE